MSYTDGNGSSESVTSTATAAVTNVNDTPSGTPTITGTAAEDQTLTADTSAISDGDGLGTLSYQWLRDGAAITGATGSTYTLGDADVGSQISVQVSYSDGNGSSESVTSTATAAVSNVNDTPSGTPTITGTVAENETLTADTSAISDGDGLGTLSYQWLRDGSAITGATGSTYTLGDADVGSQISVQVSYTDGNGSSESVTSSQTAAVTNVNDSPSGTPTITGTVAENETLTAGTSAISDGDGLGTLGYQWLRDGSAITGATGSTYTLGDADVGSQISVQVSYTDGNGSSESVTSTATAAVSNVNDMPTGTPTITGTAAEDQTLTADTSAISDGDGLGTLSYQWLRDGSAITGATGSTYTLGDPDVGSQISVQVSYTDGNGSSESVTSTATAAVTNVNDSPSGTPTITGTVAENETLTADTSAISDGDGLGTLSYQWLRDGSAITGATGSTYTLDDADVGSSISVQVSFTDGNDNVETITSTASSSVTNANDTPQGLPTITGTATEDETLTADTSGIVDDDGLGTFSYQWLRDGVEIQDATSDQYTLGDDDSGAAISVRVSYTDAQGKTESVTSAETPTIVNVNDSPEGFISIVSDPGSDTLTVNTENFSDADGITSLTYQWTRDGQPIANATQASYTLSGADASSEIRVVVSYVDSGGESEGPIESEAFIAPPPVLVAAESTEQSGESQEVSDTADAEQLVGDLGGAAGAVQQDQTDTSQTPQGPVQVASNIFAATSPSTDTNASQINASDRGEVEGVRFRFAAVPASTTNSLLDSSSSPSSSEFRQVDNTEFTASEQDLLISTLDDFQATVAQESEELLLATGVASGVFLVAGAATAVWSVSATSLVSMLSSSLPAWVNFDPVYILQNGLDPSAQCDTSMADLISDGTTSVETRS
ncbi:MAG: hypothetical protein Aurels2KO_32060 [Aureliella sp.]